ncbi:MAG: universal stress protein [Chthoniobacter sp.]|nr:universal stress protein [Chthoniobacter sp.]
MKTNSTKRKVAETLVGAAIGAAIAGPAGAVAGGLVGHQVAAHNPPGAEKKRTPRRSAQDTEDPIVHAQLKRILVPLDFWPPSRRALRFAREWAGRFGSEVHLLHVIEPTNGYGILGMDPIAPPLPVLDCHEPVQAELEKIAREEFPQSMKVSVHIRDGVPYDEIARAAAELNVDLIVIATHGRGALSHALLGSTAERVVRVAPCPVLTLRRAKHR